MVAPRPFFPVLPPLLALRVLSRSPSPIWKISRARSPSPSAMTSKDILHIIKEARHFTTRIMLKPIDDPHVDLIATVSGPLDHKPEENIIGNALFRWQSDVHDPHTFVDLYVSNSDQILQMRSCAYYPRYGFGAYGIFPLLLKKRCIGCNIWIEFLWKKLDCQILIQGKERGRCDVDSCGVHVISWLQMWDATEQEDGYTMPSYSMDEIQELKIGMLWWLMLQNGI
ncbi:hypothetical protein K1719_000194 [Acacia pycnantha]|nr:hypothetical protein K1719_000194 [Acacia pycnantha]